ncbi:MAG: HNH endonuclease [Planctomycetes bacterium RIFOXYD2_FULL_41_16]|nr:MAG: HNH endonuclease [Planctomycetes bacterium GWB2_41_19]OHB46985.1 MAG: HNH endonuclease [Planctomycetes bacterium GWE2_41_14]OHC07189.1 MAG: HNH endonuclease [Planctomycetes bacterium RIFOXYC2_FULL_41_27]OHC07438.1 MAG: HNH endonuclease [Planctomycetes bacterium RIFOXYD2_FULL_41_16]OHC08058.1 MAG: HNH endonuclease [Planctomycetes bacterium RIFOXYD12_FULL_42_12]
MQQVAALESSVLVLNKFFMALHVISAKRAFVLLCKETAEVISVDDGKFSSYNFETWKDVSLYKVKSGLPDEDNTSWIRTVSFEIAVPKIIRLLFYEKLPQSNVKFNRRNIFARDENKCQYCGRRFPTSELSLDHIVPKAYNGNTTWTNIVCACTDCNKKKGGRTPIQARMKLIRKPVKPKHSPILSLKLCSDKYRSWKQFLDEAYWSVPLK